MDGQEDTGKSFEFLLTLHTATQAPDFVYAIVTEEEFDTRVNIALRETNANIKLKLPDPDNEDQLIEITEENYASLGLSVEEWEAVQDYTKEPIKTFTPFITSVKNHWYKDLDFSDCYVVAKNNPDSTEDDEAFTSTYQYIGLEEDINNDILSGIENLYVEEVRSEDIFQVKEPAVKKNELIKEMLLGGKEGAENTEKKYKYYIYNGSNIPEKGLEKEYIIKKMGLEDGREKLNTRGFTYAFAILEAVHTEDAEYILRDLKELSKEIGIDLDETEGDKGGDEEIEPLVWPIVTLKKDKNGEAIPYKPIVWDPLYDAQNPKVIIRHKEQGTLGFDKDLNVIMPADGEIVQIIKEEERYGKESNTEGEQDSTRETSLGDAVKIKFTGTDRADLKDMYIYISGLKLDDNIKEKSTYSAKEVIGKTIETDITIIMTDNRRKVVYNVDDYIVPEEWEPLEEVKEIEDSKFEGDIFGEGGNSSSYTGSFSEQFYWYLATLEGMPITSDQYFTSANGGVNWLDDESGITVGPGIYMIYNTQKFQKYGYNFNSYDMNQVFPKDVTINVFKENVEEIKRTIESRLQGNKLSQNQMEALIITGYQRGVNDSTFNQILNYIKDGRTGQELGNIWTYAGGNFSGEKARRRKAEWYLFSQGGYLNKDKGYGEVQFTSSTPFTDMLNGTQSGRMY